MRRFLFIALGLCLLVSAGCSNHIREENAMPWDIVHGTEKVSISNDRENGAIYSLNVQFVAKKQQYDVINETYTPYSAAHELYEVPVGAIATPFAILWWAVLWPTPASGEFRYGPPDWAFAGLNPFMSVENGMFTTRNEVREQSKRPHKGSNQEPFSASIEPLGKFIEVGPTEGNTIRIPITGDNRMTINLLWVAPLLATPKNNLGINLIFKVKFKQYSKIYEKQVSHYISYRLTKKLWDVGKHVDILLDSKSTSKEIEDAFNIIGISFSREGAMAKGQLPSMKK